MPPLINTAIIGLGSNIHPRAHIDRAKDLISQKFFIAAESRWIKTKPVGMKRQPDFLNGAIFIHCPLKYSLLKQELKKIERILGRPRKHPAFGARTIDLDILVFNGVITDPQSCQMDFVRQSIQELMPCLFYAS